MGFRGIKAAYLGIFRSIAGLTGGRLRNKKRLALIEKAHTICKSLPGTKLRRGQDGTRWSPQFVELCEHQKNQYLRFIGNSIPTCCLKISPFPLHRSYVGFGGTARDVFTTDFRHAPNATTRTAVYELSGPGSPQPGHCRPGASVRTATFWVRLVPRNLRLTAVAQDNYRENGHYVINYQAEIHMEQK